jgi:magnesium chelatase family protein
MLITTCGAGFRGAIGQLVSVQLHHTRGARFHVSGMHWSHARHILARIHAALEVVGLPRPSGAFTLHIGPAHVKPESNELDVPIALCLLAVSGSIDPRKLTNLFSMGELALDGHLLISDTLLSRANFTMNPASNGVGAAINRCLIPPGGEQAMQRLIASNVPAFHAHHLKEALDFLQNSMPLQRVQDQAMPAQVRSHWPTPLFDSIKGSDENKEALVIAAAGEHHTFIMGPPGSGKTLMARALAELTPSLSHDDRKHSEHMHALRKEVLHAHDRVPYRQPHVQSTPAALTGSWNAWGAIPGELALSHRGVFCLDEFPEFARNTLEALRGPLEDDSIELNRAQGSHRFPAKSLTVATANPCPCGHLTRRNQRCHCTPGNVRKYLNRMTGPLMDRFAIHIETQLEGSPESSDHAVLYSGRQAITAVQWVRARRLEMAKESSHGFAWSEAMHQQLQLWTHRHGLSRRGFESIQKVAETVCLLEAWRDQKAIDSLKISEDHVVLATRFRIFDQTAWLDRAFNPDWPQYQAPD